MNHEAPNLHILRPMKRSARPAIGLVSGARARVSGVRLGGAKGDGAAAKPSSDAVVLRRQSIG